MAGTANQWKRTLRRAYGVPEVVSDKVATDALVWMLAKENIPGPNSTVDMRALSTLIIDAVLDSATMGELDHLLLPDYLRDAYESPTYSTGPIAPILHVLHGKRDQFSDHGESAPHEQCVSIIEGMISKLREYLTSRPLAFTAAGDDSWRFRDS